MSLILDALKKAEKQRRYGEVPGIGSGIISGSPERRSPLLLALFIPLLALLMFVLGRYWTFAPRTTEQEPVKIVTPQEQATVSSNTSEPPPVQPQQPVVQVEIPALPVETKPKIEEKPIQPQVIIPDKITPVAKARPTSPPPAVVQAPKQVAVAPAPPAPEQTVQVKTLDELPEGFVSHLPEIKIDIHSYDTRPGRSYVLINLHKYREGDYLAEGPLLVKIQPDGVVLDYLGERFHMPIGNF